jgi:hypothetical protein
MTTTQEEFSRELAKRLLLACQNAIGPGCHPDDKASDYVDNETGEPTMDPVTARVYDLVMGFCFAALDQDVYDIALLNAQLRDLLMTRPTRFMASPK